MMFVCTYVYIFIYIYICMHIHIYINVYMYINSMHSGQVGICSLFLQIIYDCM